MSPPLVSIMMPAYNAEQYIGQAIESVLAQNYTHWELVVVNDGSLDQTAEIATRYSDPRIKVIHQANAGEAAARNTALEHMQGELVAYLDADDIYLPHHLEVTAGYLQAHPDRDGVYTDGHYCDVEGTPLQTLSSQRRGPFEGRIFAEVVRASDVFGPPMCVVLRRNLIEQHHLRYDTRIVIGPDWDFFVQYTDVAEFGYVQEHTGLYRVHQTNITVQVDLQRRAKYLAICRRNAIKMASFNACPPEVRTSVFYDLLINLLVELPEQQKTVIQWPEFKQLPVAEQARLLRLMASKAIIGKGERVNINNWLQESQLLNAKDRRSALLSQLYHINPLICRWLLHTRASVQVQASQNSPFENLK